MAPLVATDARADAFVAAGAVVAPGPRGVAAVSAGKCCRQRVGFEVEYAGIAGGRESSSGTVSVNALVMLGSLSPRSRLYANAGVGVSTDLRGPLRMRAEYRVFLLGDGGSGRDRAMHRLTGGIGVAF